MLKQTLTLAIPIALGSLLSAQTTTIQAAPAAPGPMLQTSDSVFVGGPTHISTFSFSPLKTVTGVPYSADRVVETVQTLADGNRITNTTTTHTYRDSKGRTRTETSISNPSGTTMPALISIHDPVAGVSYLLNSHDKTAQKISSKPFTLNTGNGTTIEVPPPPPPPPPTGSGAAGGVTTMVYTANGGPSLASVRPDNPDMTDTKTEDLGTQTIEGVPAKGTRTTQTIPAGSIGNEQPIQVTSERWYSTDLQMVVKSLHSDPRFGQTSETVTNLNRSEPDPSLFQVPSDYTVTESKGGPTKVFFNNKQ